MNGQRSFNLIEVRRDSNPSEVDMPNTIIGTSGDDIIYGTSGSDIYYPGASMYSNTIYDPGGDDHYVLVPSYTEIYDLGGTDVVTMAGYDLADLNFMVFDEYTVAIWSDDDSIGAWFVGMWNNPTNGVDSLVLDDVTLSRAQILTYANELFGL